MKMIFKIALRNVFRQKRRSSVTAGTAAVGVAGILLYLAVMNGMLQEMVDSALGLRLPSVIIEKYQEGKYEPFKIDPEILDRIKKTEGVKGVAPRLIREALVTTADYSVEGGSRGVRVYGIDPEAEKSVLNVQKMMSEGKGEWFSSDKDYNDISPVVIGEALADRMNLDVGGHIIMTIIKNVKEDDAARKLDKGNMSYDTRMLLQVIGIFRTSDTGFEKNNLYILSRTLKTQLPGIEEGAIHTLAISTEKFREREIVNKIKGYDSVDYDVLTWKEKDPFLSSNLDFFDEINYVFLFIVLLASSFVLVNTMLMVVQERMREFGMIKAMGATGSHAAFLIIIEGIILGIIGVIAGVLLSAPIVIVYYFVGLDLAWFSEGLRSVGIPVTLSPFWKWHDLIITSVAMIVFSFIGSLFPAIKAARIKILDAINFQ